MVPCQLPRRASSCPDPAHQPRTGLDSRQAKEPGYVPMQMGGRRLSRKRTSETSETSERPGEEPGGPRAAPGGRLRSPSVRPHIELKQLAQLDRFHGHGRCWPGEKGIAIAAIDVGAAKSRSAPCSQACQPGSSRRQAPVSPNLGILRLTSSQSPIAHRPSHPQKLNPLAPPLPPLPTTPSPCDTRPLPSPAPSAKLGLEAP